MLHLSPCPPFSLLPENQPSAARSPLASTRRCMRLCIWQTLLSKATYQCMHHALFSRTSCDPWQLFRTWSSVERRRRNRWPMSGRRHNPFCPRRGRWMEIKLVKESKRDTKFNTLKCVELTGLVERLPAIRNKGFKKSNLSIFLMLVTNGSLGLLRESMSTLNAVLVTTSILYAPKNLNMCRRQRENYS